MDIKTVYDMLDRFEGSDLIELEVELGDGRMHMKRERTTPVAYVPCGSVYEHKEESAPADNHAAQGSDTEKEAKMKEVRAPLIGTFYAAASPDEEPFVSVGKRVKKGDVIGIIEAMKLMNEVTSPVDGLVAEIEAVNGELVEYGQVLVTLRQE